MLMQLRGLICALPFLPAVIPRDADDLADVFDQLNVQMMGWPAV